MEGDPLSYEGYIFKCQDKDNKIIIFKQVLTDKKKEEKMRETKRQKQMSSWGYKFEQLVTSAGPDTAPDTEAPVNENEEFCCLFRTRIAGVSVVFGAEMDAYKSNVRLVQF